MESVCLSKKRCSKCGLWLGLVQFNPDRTKRDGLASSCRECGRVRSARWHAQNRETANGRRRDWNQQNWDRVAATRKANYQNNREKYLDIARMNREKIAADPVKQNAVKERQREWRQRNKAAKWAYNLRDNYGITAEDYLLLWTYQGGVCYLCHTEGDLVVDHCHTTGRVRGLLHGKCNSALGMLGDGPELIAALQAHFAKQVV